MIVVIIKADFTPGDDFLVMCEFLELREIGVLDQLSFVRMEANRGVDHVVLVCKFNGTVERTRAVARANGKKICEARFAGASDHMVAIGVKARTFKMAVGVDEHNYLTPSRLL